MHAADGRSSWLRFPSGVVSGRSGCSLATLGAVLLTMLFSSAAPLPAEASAGPDSLRAPFQRVASVAGEVRFEFVGDLAGASRDRYGRLVVSDVEAPSTPINSSAVLPIAATWIALPPRAHARVECQVVSTEPLPWPAAMTGRERAAVLASLAPSGWRTAPECWTRDQWGRPISFRPVIPDGSGGLLYVRRADFVVRYPAPAGGALSARRSIGTDFFENTYRALFLNYQDGRSWRRSSITPTFQPIPKRAQAPSDSNYFSASDHWVKLHVPRLDVWEVTGTDLESLQGISLTDIDPRTLRLFKPDSLPLSEYLDWAHGPSWMQEVPIEFQDVNGDGIFDPEDRIVFLGHGPDGWYEDLGAPKAPFERYYRDPFNNDDVYWLTWGGRFSGTPKRIRTVNGNDLSGVNGTATSVRDRIHLEQDLFWDARPREYYPDNPTKPAAAWQRYWWLALQVNGDQPQKLPVSIPDPDTLQPVSVLARFWGDSHDPSGYLKYPDHALILTLNEDSLHANIVKQTDRLPDGSPWNLFTRNDVAGTGLWLKNSPTQTFQMWLPTHPLNGVLGTRYDTIFLAWIEMDYNRRLIAHSDSLFFWAGVDSSGGGISGPWALRARGFSPGLTADQIYLLDATNVAYPDTSLRRVVPLVVPDSSGLGGSDVLWKANFDGSRRFILRRSDRLARFGAGQIELAPTLTAGQYLRQRTDRVDGLVITHANFKTQAQELATHRSTHFPDAPGETKAVSVVDVQQIMDEFAFGQMDPTAIRNFLQFTRGRWTGGDTLSSGPAYAVLLGSCNYDFRNLLRQGAVNYVPTYEGYFDSTLVPTIYSPQFSSDDFFGYLDGPDDVGLDVRIGRLPADNATEAETMVEKIKNYEVPSPRTLGPWQGRFTLVADDTCQGVNPDALGLAHVIQTEQVGRILPQAFQQDKVYLLEYGAGCVYSTKPAAAAALAAFMNQGTLVVNFTGHGSEEQLADERVFELSSVAGLTNATMPFLFLTASCSVGKYDFFGEGLGESLVRDAGGGAVAVFAASSIAYSGDNSELNKQFFEAAFPDGTPGSSRPLGEADDVAKTRLLDPGNLNSRRYVLLGDPATALAAPQLKVALSLSQAHDHTPLGNTLRRGVRTVLHGQVEDQNGTPRPDFSGTAVVRIYDSGIGRVPDPKQPDADYDLLGAPIFRGEGIAVANGVFDVMFQTPSALETGNNLPYAKIYVYTQATAGQTEGAGDLDSLVVPQIPAPVTADNQGPSIQLDFPLENANSLPAGADFTATLTDSSGVDITGLVGSRSVVMQILDGSNLVYIEDVARLVTFPNGYSTARLEYSLPANLPVNRTYELVLSASDNLGNSSELRKTFSLAGGGGSGFGLSGVFNFPNPTKGETRFFGQLTQDADLEVVILTLTGRRIRKLEGTQFTPARFTQEGLDWDGKDADGDRLANGVYLYKVRATPVGGGKTESVIGRLVVLR